MGAGLSHALDLREKRRQEKLARKATAGGERRGGSRVKTEPIAATTGLMDANQGSPGKELPSGTIPRASVPTEVPEEALVPPQDGSWTEGGILNHAHGVRFEGPTTLNSASNSYHYTNIYNQPDVPEHGAHLAILTCV
ncbi:hypothetical protein FA15DRAFT_371045 [Coprinopsis marcescibilis]|uniref:Uncharacterized protein n=1 Tax=Coprinopsis marcescibilis TaxID=230819 RepID=A0A5C3KA90_COPMA|nr:hypothetical protein FA15DRAFT_371045 [Coprinopsis marcescibilis]